MSEVVENPKKEVVKVEQKKVETKKNEHVVSEDDDFKIGEVEE